ncbi:MAG: tRNA (adenosine(37)-N6)-dimethylallyltransferase MiaA, partial [Candidatus Paceibacterota bacterium]
KIQPTVLVILGPTASGKSDLAVKIAKRVQGEVVSADSRQVYRGLDIGTGKITLEEMQGVPHHLIDVCPPKKVFTVAEYQKMVLIKVQEILARGHVPIIAGGTGFYIDAVTRGVVLPEVPPSKALRKKLEKFSDEELFAHLLKIDKTRARAIKRKNELKNRVRMIRAIEVATTLGKVPKIKHKKPPYTFVYIGVAVKETTLRQKIARRVARMFEAGLLDEIEKLKHQGVSKKRLQEFGFEYNEPTPESVIEASYQYVKRQMTWFRRHPDITWLSPSQVVAFAKSKLREANKTLG